MNKGNWCPDISSNLSRFMEGCVSNMREEFNVMQKRPVQIFCVQGNQDTLGDICTINRETVQKKLF